MSVRNLDALFRPASIALIADGPVGAVLARNLFAGGFDGPVMPVTPGARSVGSALAYPSVAALPMAPDLAVIAAPPDALPGLIAELGGRGTRAAAIVGIDRPAGAEGPVGRRLRQAMLDAARPHLLRILGPDGFGLMAPHHGVNASLGHVAPQAGDLAFVSQSGAVAAAVLDRATRRGIGFSHVVSLGGMADVDFGDMLDWLAADGRTRAVLLHVETVSHARKFMSAARAVARTRPVVVIRPGHGAPGAGDADGLIGPDAVYDAAFRRAGMLRVFDLAELFDAVETLASGLKVGGERLAILTNGAGLGLLAAEALADSGGSLAVPAPATLARLDAAGAGPIDLGDAAPADRFARALEALLADPGRDAVLVVNGPSAIADPVAAARAVAGVVAAAAKRDGRRPPVLASWLGAGVEAGALFAEAHIPAYDTPGQAARAFMHLARHRRNQGLLMQTPPALPEDFQPDAASARAVIAAALAEGRAELTPAEARSVLDAYRIPLLPEGAALPPEPHPLVLGIDEDPVFGPILLFGQGGAAAELLHDGVAALPPLNAVLARDLMMRARVWRLLQGYRGRPAADLDAVALTLVKLSQLAADLSEVAALRINPLLAGAGGVLAPGAEIRVQPPLPPGTPRFAIRPYPQRLVQHLALRDGREVTLRPVRPEDEPAMREMLQRSSPEDVRLRFFSAMRSFSHEFAARLTQIDYDREMALVAEAGEDGQRVILGAVRIIADPDGEAAEYGIMVRSDLKGQGLGHRLMTEIIDYARSRGLKRIFGEVLRENTTMLRMAGEFGFARADVPDEPGIIHVTISLDDLPALSQHS
ncbi:GNAT family N-acetyltransferase [Mycobacterium sp. KBS0706]|uniref:bifunctional acetate--CoA ligase family protein/GNAT family N-acetyltransferase n=1 Tax=Mycobacterium sp. KBS0706 TaxID=2578109 RepID=UPI00110F94ED|nr:bifunctional acetate--CoA ligase family protein/GNAT family N-acetyltransferase [Mycobacterium sp. KBS0706]TSD85742.1 GNAT family N-acetyltransferase [Mycobacterium sp. KBS0706]